MRSLFVATLLAAASAVVAQAPQCTHTTIQLAGGSVVPTGVQPCGSGVTINVAGHALNLTLHHCPLFVIATPAHRTSLREPGCGTDVRLRQVLPVKHIAVDCIKWPAVFLPIFSVCYQGKESVMRQIDDMMVVPCAKIPE